MFKTDAIDHIVEAANVAIVNNDGFTIYAESGATFTQPDTYMVGGVIPALILHPSQTLADVYSEIREWYRIAKTIHPTPIVGGWMNDGFLYLDLITVVEAESEALLLGRTWKQVSVGSLNSAGTFIELEVAN